jgi:hypothetical protein
MCLICRQLLQSCFSPHILQPVQWIFKSHKVGRKALAMPFTMVKTNLKLNTLLHHDEWRLRNHICTKITGLFYIGWITNTCQNLNCNISITLHYIWSIFLTLLLHDVVFIPCKLYDCSFMNIPTASKTKHEVKNCNDALTYFVVLQHHV